ncbi:SH3 domain-containing protein [Weizmannia coagulans]|nr:SH3 domain-containing protein [Heyndrickxia coagulans]
MKKGLVIPLCFAVLSTPAFDKTVQGVSLTKILHSSSVQAAAKTETKYVNVDSNSSLTLRAKPSKSAAKLDSLKKGTAVLVYNVSDGWAEVKAGTKTGYVSAEYLTSTKPGSTATTTSTAKTTTKYVNVDKGSHLILRSKTSTSSSILASLPRGEKVTVYSISGAWAKVKAGSKTGYVHASFLANSNPDSNAGTSTPAKTTTKYVNVDKGSHLILRSKTSTSSSILASLPRGEKVTVYSISGAWAKVKAGNKTGYVHASFLANSNPDSNAGTSTPAKTTTKYVNVDKGSHLILRSKTSTSSSILASLPRGEKVTVYSISGAWAKVKAGNKTGYVHASFLANSNPDSNAGTSTPAKTTTKYVNVDKGSHLILRSKTSTSSSILASLPRGEKVTVYSISGAWAKVKAGNKTGYVHASFLANSNPDSNAGTSTPAKTTTKYVNVDKGSHLILRSKTSTSSSILASLPRGEKVTVYSISGAWAKVKAGSKTGYVHASFLANSNPDSNAGTSTPAKTTTKYVNVDKGSHLILRSKTSTSSSILASLPRGEKVTVYSISGAWAKVKAGNKTGYVHASFLANSNPDSNAGTSTPAKTTTKYVNVDKGSHLILRSKTSTSSSILASLPRGEKVTVYSISGAWAKVKAGNKTGYVHASFLTNSNPDSNAGTSTPVQTTTKYVNVDKGSHLVLRSKASRSGKILASLQRGEKVTVYTASGPWVKVKARGITGYVLASYLSNADPDASTADDSNNSSEPTPDSTVTKYTTADLNLRKGPSKSASVIEVLDKGTAVKVYSEEDGWAKVEIGGKIGYVSTNYLTSAAKQSNGKVTSIVKKYDLSLDELANIQMKVSPQTDTNERYIRSDAIKLTSHTTGVVQNGNWHIRDGAGTKNHEVGETLKEGTKVTILSTVKGNDGYTWYQISYNKAWKNATKNEVKYYLNPNNFVSDPVRSLQFLKLTSTANLNATEVNQKILAGKGILAGKASAFLTAAKQNGINEIYLIAHALLETGNGTSQLANGVKYNGKTVYNMYGTGANDGNAVQNGARYAYQHGWTTPEAAIIGGAKFISSNYLGAGQDTLYKMRWNPDVAATYGYASHQYATDIGWAYKQVDEIYNLYNLLDNYNITLEVPSYQ